MHVFLAHAGLGNWDELVFFGIAMIFVVMMGISWVKSRNLQFEDFEDDETELNSNSLRKHQPNKQMRKIIILLSFCYICLATSSTLAHGYIVRAIPENRSTLEYAPTRLQYWFSEDLEPAFSSIKVRDQTGAIIAEGGVTQDDAAILRVQLPADLADGAYIVELRPAFASDGHVVAESQVFFVGQSATDTEGMSASDDAILLEVFWRILVISSTIILFGVTALYSHILVPAWGSRTYRSGYLAPFIMTRLNWIVAIALALAFAGNILALLQQTMVFFDLSASQVIEQGLWRVVRVGSRFGDVWNIRMVLLGFFSIMHIAGIYFRKTYPETVRAFWSANVWVMALVIATLSINSHATGSLILPWLAFFMDWLHAVASAFWVGGVLVFVLILPIIPTDYRGKTRQQMFVQATGRFSRILIGIVAIVITTGIYNASNWFYSVSDIETTYGGALGLKILMVALLLGMGAIHHIALRPQLAVQLERSFLSHSLVPSNLRLKIIRAFYAIIRQAEKFATTLRLESVFVILVIVAVGWLSATPIPEPEFLQTDVQIMAKTQSIGDLDVTLSIIPGGVGINTYDIALRNRDEFAEDVIIALQQVHPARDQKGEVLIADAVSEAVFVAVDDVINREGEWWSLVDITTANSTRRLAYTWTITDESNILQSQNPTLLTMVAFISVVISVGYVIYPTLQAIYVSLALTRTSFLLGLALFGFIAVVFVVSASLIKQRQQEYEDQLNPLPEIVNMNIPDQESLNRGENLYSEACPNWQSFEDDFSAFATSLRILRDEEIYRATERGWRDLPPCNETLSATNRWDIVNYVHTWRDKNEE